MQEAGRRRAQSTVFFARETMGSKFATADGKEAHGATKTTGLLDKFKVSKLPFGVGVPSATFTSGEGRSVQLRLTRHEK